MDSHPDARYPDRDRLWRLIQQVDAEPRSTKVADVLGRLCRTAVTELDLRGATVVLPPRPDAHVVAAASDEAARRLEEMQFDTGEGPTLEACRVRFPVLAPDIASIRDSRWPGFAQAASAAGVGAAFALPLHVGASLLGALTFYRSEVGPLSPPRMRAALVLGDIAVEILIDGTLSSDLGAEQFGDAIDGQAHVFQAQGMVMVQLGVTLTEALARMRAHAYAQGLTLAAVSTAILDGAITLDEGEPE